MLTRKHSLRAEEEEEVDHCFCYRSLSPTTEVCVSLVPSSVQAYLSVSLVVLCWMRRYRAITQVMCPKKK
jgi:hypothetical protein